MATWGFAAGTGLAEIGILDLPLPVPRQPCTDRSVLPLEEKVLGERIPVLRLWAMDRALTKTEVAELRFISTRAVITLTSSPITTNGET